MKRSCAFVLAACVLAGAMASPCAAQATSRAASTQASQPSSAASRAMHDGKPNLGLLAVGVVILLCWGASVAARPQKLALRQVPGRPSRLTTAHFGLVLLAVLMPQLLVSSYYEYVVHGKPSPEVLLPIGIAVQLLGIVVCLLVARSAFVHGIGNGLGLNLRHPVRDIVWAVLAVLAVLPVVTVLHMLSTWAMIEYGHKPEMNPVLQYVGASDMGWITRILAAASAVLLAPLAEELMFRGILQSMLRTLRIGPWPAILGSSTLFCIMHMGVPQDVLPLAPLALLLGYSYERCGRLTVPILIHAMFNAVSVVSVAMSRH